MKRGVRIINVGRGPIIDENALIEALNNNVVHSVALDVFENEPLPLDSPLRKYENCIFGSHNSSNTIDGVSRTSCKTIEILSERKSVVVIDYGMGNVQSLCNAINKIGAKSILTSEPDLYNDASFWALPGVGAFPEGMKRLKKMNLVDKLRERSANNKGIIGICLGMQLLFEESEEYGLTKGIGIFEGNVTKLPEEDQILPHVGWNKLFKTQNKNFLSEKIDDNFYQYFVHSFAVKNNNGKDKFSLYDFKFGGKNFIAASKKLNTYGFQFHPERSGQLGLNLLSEVIQNF